MKKLAALRAHMLAAVPGLAANPEHLLTYVNDGTIEFYSGPNLTHGYQLTANVVITDYAGDLDAITVPLLEWLTTYNPDIDPAQAVRIEAEILANDRLDIALTVSLAERVVTRVDAETGAITIDHRMPAYPGHDIDANAGHWTLYADDTREDAGPRELGHWPRADAGSQWPDTDG
ncbi:phage tail protein [Salinisphaera sp. USBA-960]|nr:phage tail protein [Salifodinibacter halophilus]NNC25307.1 phage tail protein [Salifodinibacter halophilus]